MAGSTRPARIEITADSRSLTAGLRRASSQVAGFAATSARVVGRYGGASAVVLGQTALGGVRAAGRGVVAVGKASRKAAGQAVMGAAAIGTAALVSAAADVRDFEETLQRLGQSADRTPAQMAAMRAEVRRASRDTGVASNEILNGAKTYVELTGDLDGAQKMQRTFAEVTQASGAQMTDVSSTAAAMQDALKIDPSQMEAAFSALIVQGKAGSVELKDMASEMASLAPTMAGFAGGTGLAGLRQLGAALQVTRKGFGSASEAATGMVSLTTSLKKHAGTFQAAGVKLFTVDKKTGVKTFRNFADIVKEIGASKLAKDPAKLAKAFGSVEALRTFTELNRNAALYDELIKKGADVGAVQRDLTAYLASSPGKMAKAWNNMKEAIAAALTPERIKAFADAMVSVASAINTVVAGIDRIGKKVGDAWGEIIFGKTPEEKAADEEIAARKERATKIRWMRGFDVTEEQAMQQVYNEDAAYKSLRHGDLNHRSSADLEAMKQRVKHGAFSNRERMMLPFDNAIAAAKAREGSAWQQAMLHGKGSGMVFGPMAEARRQQLLTQADANMLASALTRALLGAMGGNMAPTFALGSDVLAHTVKAAPSVRRRPGGGSHG